MSERTKVERASRLVAVSFGVSALASLALTVVYFFGGQVQLEGILLGLALGGLCIGFAIWGKDLMPGGPYVEERPMTFGEAEGPPASVQAFEAGAQRIERRGFLGKMLGAAVAGLGIAAIFPVRSLGTRPGKELAHTHWTPGARVVTRDEVPLRPEDLTPGVVLTVFPEGHTDAADSQTLLIKLRPGLYEPRPGREGWAPEDIVGFSKICTHAGCPVGLYQPATHELFCPCHQSVFLVLQGAKPSGGPATRPLPQLPLEIDESGYLVAQRDFSEPVGSGFWSRPRA